MSQPSTIAHYRITGKLGEGGMGAVYRATDTKLNRDVAIKVLPDAFADDRDRMARFGREAQVLASLNHPNIAAIHGVEERAIVMELVEGQTLAGPLPIEDALPIISQLIDALEYAHEKGVVHRDLKPANIIVTPEGRVKVLDFGLAKAMSGEASQANPANSPTLTMGATTAGVIMGTAGYMSPEQARGHDVDRRADIWAFGVVVYELVTGNQLFEGPTVSDTLAAVLTREPNLDAVPTVLRRLVRVCLMRDPRQRLRDISGARLLLDHAEPERHVQTLPASKLLWAVGVGMAVALAGMGALLWKATRPVERPVARLSVDLGPDAVPETNVTAAISPDGTRIAFVAKPPGGPRQIATRLLAQRNVVLLPGTENPTQVFFSPDGRWIGFTSDFKLRKIPVDGGAVVTLCDVPVVRGAHWGDDDHIVVSTNRRLLRVPAAGGKPEELPSSGFTQRTPYVLPGGQAILYSATSGGEGYENARIEVLSLKTRQSKVVGTGYFPRYLPSGHLTFVRQGALLAQRFDLASLSAQGAAIPVVEDLAASPVTGMGQYEFSNNGTLVYLSGKAVLPVSRAVWVDRSGKTQPIAIPLGLHSNPRLSADGRRLLLIKGVSTAGELWRYDFERELFSRLTLSRGGISYPVWTPDGKHVIYAQQENGSFKLWLFRADGGGEPQLLTESKTRVIPTSFSPDGRRLLITQVGEQTGLDLWTLPIDTRDPGHPKAGPPEAFLRSADGEAQGAFSPDGKWIAHGGLATGKIEVYVRPFPEASGGWMISNGGGDYPVWLPDGRTLLYQAQDGRIMEVAYEAKGDSFVAGKPRPWTEAPLPSIYIAGGRQYDISPDGKRLLIVAPLESDEERKGNLHVTFVFNFFDEVKRRIPE